MLSDIIKLMSRVAKKKEGFTLIELLIVIAIIGILSTIVVVLLSESRNKANDGKIIAQFKSLQSAAESFYVASGNNYGADTTDCSDVGSMFQDNEIKSLVTGTNYPTGTALNCMVDSNAYAVSANLSNGKYFCIDSTGSSYEISSAITGASCQ